MNVQQSSTSTFERPDARNESETRLHGNFLLIARVGWIVFLWVYLYNEESNKEPALTCER